MAIAFDAFTSGGATGTSATISHTTSGSDRLLLVACSVAESTTSDVITGVTYNGVSMTLLGKNQDGLSYWIYLYGLLAPATGANNVVVSRSTSGAIEANIASYTGVSQTGLPDAVVSTDTASPTCTRTLTTIADNCWLADGGIVHRGNTAGASTFKRDPATTNTMYFDSNGARTPAGSQSLVSTQSDSTAAGWVTVSFAPSVAGGATKNNLLMMGVT